MKKILLFVLLAIVAESTYSQTVKDNVGYSPFIRLGSYNPPTYVMVTRDFANDVKSMFTIITPQGTGHVEVITVKYGRLGGIYALEGIKYTQDAAYNYTLMQPVGSSDIDNFKPRRIESFNIKTNTTNIYIESDRRTNTEIYQGMTNLEIYNAIMHPGL